MSVFLRRALVCTFILAASGRTAPALAGTVDFCGGAAGWRATWDSSLDPFVLLSDADCTHLANGTLVIRKSAQFTQGPSNGVFPTVAIAFDQTMPTLVTRIAIDDETITNLTGVPWTDFHFDLIDSGDAVFDPVATAASGGPLPIGFNIAPFTVAAFANNNTRLNVSGGIVPNGSQWLPGSGPNGGQLVMNLHAATVTPFTVFALKETPTPEPSSLALLGMSLIPLSRRRRSGSR